MDASRSEVWDRGSLDSWPSDLWIPNNIQEVSGIVNFLALYSVSLSRCQSDMRPIVQMRWRPWAFSMVSTGDSDILSSCDMKDVPAFQPLQGNPAFFQVRESRGPFPWSTKHRVKLTDIFLRENSSWGACGNLAYLFSRKQGNSSHLQMI